MNKDLQEALSRWNKATWDLENSKGTIGKIKADAQNQSKPLCTPDVHGTDKTKKGGQTGA